MSGYEYKVVPAPKKGQKDKKAKGYKARFASTLAKLINEHGAEGWEYMRSDTFPYERRSVLGSKLSGFQNMLVFRRDQSLESMQAEKSVSAPVEETAESSAPLVESTTDTDNNNAPEVGPATEDEATEVKAPPPVHLDPQK